MPKKAKPKPRTPVAIDPGKLIEEARRGIKKPTGRPRSVSLRRAVSAAYYALFHSISKQAAVHLLPNAAAEDQLRVARLFGHQQIKAVCETIAGGNANKHLEPLANHLANTDIANVASSFRDLQEARHDADYNHLEPFSQQATVSVINEAEAAIKALNGASDSDREMFFALLALRARSGG